MHVVRPRTDRGVAHRPDLFPVSHFDWRSFWIGVGCGFPVALLVFSCVILTLGKWAETRPYVPGPFSRPEQ